MFSDNARLKRGDTVDFDSCLANPARRRMFLLTKALEHNSLSEALRLAQAAEAFLTGRGAEMAHSSDPHTSQFSGLLH
jgi:hypothetical protein